MRKLPILPVALLASLVVHAYAAEHKVDCSTVPAAVQDNARKLLNGAMVKGCVKDVSNGKTTWEMELVKDNRSKDITFAPSGTVLEVEEQVDLATLPAPVAAAFQKASAGGKLGKIESLTRGTTLVSYEGVVTRNGKRREIAFHPDGSAMKAD